MQWPHRDQLRYYQELHAEAEANESAAPCGSEYDSSGNFTEGASTEGGGSGTSSSYMNQSLTPNQQFLQRKFFGINTSRNQCDLPRDGQGNGLAPTPPAGVGAVRGGSVLGAQVTEVEAAAAMSGSEQRPQPPTGHFLEGTNPNLLSLFTPCRQ